MSKVIGFASVVGDMLHAGHILYLNEAKNNCDFLYCGIIANPRLDRPEKNEPVQSLYERWVQVSSHRAVDCVVPLMGEADLMLAIKSLPINIRFVGSDYYGKGFTGKEWCLENGILIHYCSRNHGLSSTELRKRVATLKNNQREYSKNERE